MISSESDFVMGKLIGKLEGNEEAICRLFKIDYEISASMVLVDLIITEIVAISKEPESERAKEIKRLISALENL